jgi:hypothetical protein
MVSIVARFPGLNEVEAQFVEIKVALARLCSGEVSRFGAGGEE